MEVSDLSRFEVRLFVLLFGGRGLGAEKEVKGTGTTVRRGKESIARVHYYLLPVHTPPDTHATCTMERVRVTSSVGGRRRKCGKV